MDKYSAGVTMASGFSMPITRVLDLHNKLRLVDQAHGILVDADPEKPEFLKKAREVTDLLHSPTLMIRDATTPFVETAEQYGGDVQEGEHVP